MKLYICNFYSYSDRKLLYYESLSMYNATCILSNFSFKYNDNINTEQIVNVKPNGNYILLCKDDDTIESRWYIVNIKKHRTNQYSLVLKRDVLADYYDSFKNIPMMINRGTPLSTTDINIFNPENISFNKIKSDEYEIKDETQCPWIVGYIPRNFPDTAKKISVKTTQNSSSYNIEVDNIVNWDYYKYVTQEQGSILINALSLQCNFNRDPQVSPAIVYSGNISVNGNISTQFDYTNISTSLTVDATQLDEHNPLATFTTKFTEWSATIRDRLEIIQNMLCSKNGYGHITNDDFNTLLTLNGSRIKDTTTGNIYDIEVSFNKAIYSLETTKYIDMDTYLNNSIVATDGLTGQFYYGNSTYFFNDFRGNIVTVKLNQLTNDTYEFTIPVSTDRINLKDQPYDMFCMPYEDIVIAQPDDTYLTFNKNISLKLAQAISEQLGSSSVYDIQILPFCPNRSMIREDFVGPAEKGKIRRYSINDTGISNIPVYLKSTSSQTIIQKIYWCESSNFKLNIPLNKERQTKNTEDTYGLVSPKASKNMPAKITDMKVINLTESMRFCAPDYSNFFEFNYLMNNGFHSINVECTYMPYQPYIRVYPDFDYLYGRSFNDSRGLILKGDYSIPQLTSTWANYKMNNKNYLNTFNLETQVLTRKNQIAQSQDIFGAITGTMQGATAGAMTGSMVGGGPVGAVVGGVVGGISSGIGGVADIFTNNELRQLSMDQRQKNFNFSIENMQAIPYGLSSSGTFNFNRHLFPFIEYYKSTDEEVSLLKD